MAAPSMPSERTRVDRRLDVAPAARRPAASGAVVIFRDEWGAVDQVFDLTVLGLSGEITTLFADAFRTHYAGSAAATRKACWKALRTFARFIADSGGIDASGDLGTEAIGRYIAWLDRQRSNTGEPWSTATRHGRFVYVKMMLVWAMRNRPGRLPAPLRFPHNPFPGRHRTPVPRRLSAPQLKAILRACYDEIDTVSTCFTEGQVILARMADPPVSGRRSDFERLLQTIHRSGDGVMPRYRSPAIPGESRLPFDRHGGARKLAQYLHLTVDTLVPFFLAIAIQTAANPDALRLIGRDCIVPHPLDEHRAVIDWAKPRSGGAVRRAQRRSFDRRRPHAAPNLIDKVLAMTAPLAAHAPASERGRLFLIRGNRPSGIKAIGSQTLSAGICRFIARANGRVAAWNDAHPDRPRAPLPTFAPVLFRGSVATEHYHAEGGDIRAAQAVMNHARADTTDLYVRGLETQRLQEATVARLQALMVAWITGGRGPHDPVGTDPAFIALGKNANAFGHVCANPLAGIAPGAVPGRLCPRFGVCLTCPGLVIPIDAEHLARVLQAKRKLECARDRIDPHRWRLLYAPSHRILTDDILPDFPAELHTAAARMMPALPSLPDLE
jgi:integrase